MVILKKQNFRKNKKLFNEVAQQLRKNLNASIPIHHVGSTAIPNMVGKNIVDILIGAKDKAEFLETTNVLIDMGYFSSKNQKNDIYEFFASSEDETGSGDIHLHLVLLNTERYAEFIVLKNYLLHNKNEALSYSNYKKELIKKGILNRKDYRTVKSEYVTKLIERAKENLIIK